MMSPGRCLHVADTTEKTMLCSGVAMGSMLYKDWKPSTSIRYSVHRLARGTVQLDHYSSCLINIFRSDKEVRPCEANN